MAKVGQRQVLQSQVDQAYHQKFAQREIGETLQASLRAQILNQITRQQMVLDKLEGTELRATADEIDLEIYV